MAEILLYELLVYKREKSKDKDKEDKINKGEHRSKNVTPTTFKNGNK